jgi:hypothetical protein
LRSDLGLTLRGVSPIFFCLKGDRPVGWLRNGLIWAVVLLPLAGALSACEEGPAEKAGEAVDEAVEDAGRAVEDAAD